MRKWVIIFAADLEQAKACARKHKVWGHWVWAWDRFEITGLRPDRVEGTYHAEGWRTNSAVVDAYEFWTTGLREAA